MADKSVQLTTADGVTVNVAEAKVDALLARGLTKAAPTRSSKNK